MLEQLKGFLVGSASVGGGIPAELTKIFLAGFRRIAKADYLLIELGRRAEQECRCAGSPNPSPDARDDFRIPYVSPFSERIKKIAGRARDGRIGSSKAIQPRRLPVVGEGKRRAKQGCQKRGDEAATYPDLGAVSRGDGTGRGNGRFHVAATHDIPVSKAAAAISEGIRYGKHKLSMKGMGCTSRPNCGTPRCSPGTVD